MSEITPSILARLQAIADHSAGDGATVADYLRYIKANAVGDVGCYLDILEMQLDLVAAANRFYDLRIAAGDNQATILCGLGGSFGIVVGRISHKDPVEGREIASHVGQMIAERFNRLMAQWFAWRDSAPPKLPTHDIISNALN